MCHNCEIDRPATIAEADAEYARNVGAENPESEWILSDRDVWYRNPAYTGKPGPHPEDDRDDAADASAYGNIADMESDLPFASTGTTTPAAPLTKERVIEMHFERCKKCGGTGYFRSYSGRNLGSCFACKGKGQLAFKTAPEARAKARQAAVARKERSMEENLAVFAETNPAEWAWMNGNTFGFAVAMVDAVKKYGHLTENQLAAVKRCMEARQKAQAAAQERVANAVDVSLVAVEAAFQSAFQAGIKHPKLNLDTFQFKPAKAHSANAGAIYVTESGEYLGKVMGGKFIRTRACTDDQQARIQAVAADPHAAAVAYGKRFGSCSVCGRELSNEDSIDRGIGPICAEKFGW